MRSIVTAALVAALFHASLLSGGAAKAKHEPKFPMLGASCHNEFITVKGYGRKPLARKKARFRAIQQWEAVTKTEYHGSSFWSDSGHKRIKCQKIKGASQSSGEYDIVCTATALPCW